MTELQLIIIAILTSYDLKGVYPMDKVYIRLVNSGEYLMYNGKRLEFSIRIAKLLKEAATEEVELILV